MIEWAKASNWMESGLFLSIDFACFEQWLTAFPSSRFTIPLRDDAEIGDVGIPIREKVNWYSGFGDN